MSRPKANDAEGPEVGPEGREGRWVRPRPLGADAAYNAEQTLAAARSLA